MKEKPIIFTAESVLAILDGRKTQTRRPVKFALTSQSDGAKRRIFSERDIDEINQLLSIRQTHPLNTFAPYQVGDRLWVKEAFAFHWVFDADRPSEISTDAAIWYGDEDQTKSAKGRQRSPRFMPRWASRLTLEVTAVRVERLQDISRKDVKEESVTDPQSLSDPPSDTGRPIEWFSAAWDEINGKRAPWASNSWVWVVEFQRVGL